VAGGVIVVKAGGRVIDANAEGLLKSVAAAAGSYKVVLVHGGGDEVTKYSKLMGIEPRFVVSPSGVRSRYTTWEELQVYVMVMAGLINKRLVSKLVSMGVRALGVAGVDGGIVAAERKRRIIVLDERGRKRVIEGGYTGRITRVDSDILAKLLEVFDVIVVAPVALGDEGVPLNVDGDQMAYAVATALRSEKLLLLTDVDGVIVDGRLVGRLSPLEAERLAARVGAGMNRKLLMAAKAVREGVREAVIASGLGEDPIGEALSGSGTRITQ
jgi:acetylglutamate/LysW-gamma-L-alpha-aminoadipate kinase